MIGSRLVNVVLGGGCHWCTEAVFDSLKGVSNVDQGWAASTGKCDDFSEAVMMSVDTSSISLKTIIEVHLLTHSSTSNHSMRGKYRSAIYIQNIEQAGCFEQVLSELNESFDEKLITKVLLLKEFKSNSQYQNYFYQDPSRLFCQRYISPKLALLTRRFAKHAKIEKINSALKL